MFDFDNTVKQSYFRIELHPTLNELAKNGILVCVNDFLALYQLVIPLFELVVFAKIYPNRGTKEWSKHGIREILIGVLKKFSLTHLSNTCGATEAHNFPREVAFQHQFFRCAMESLLPKVKVIPEMFQVFGTKGLLRLFVVVKYR